MSAARPDLQRRMELAAIHIGRQKLGLDDDSYRDLLEQVTGKRSAAALTPRERAAVLERMRQAGFRHRSGGRRPATAISPQARKAQALWWSLYQLGEIESASDRALDAFVAGDRGPRVRSLRFCTPEQTNHVIEALKEWCGRAGFAQPDREQIAAIERARAVAALPPAEPGFAAKVALIEAQWRRLTALGALRHGSHANLGSWLMQRAGVAAPQFLPGGEADAAAAALGDWIRKVKGESGDS